ncbi:DUF7064 domain-containing protein [Chelatococcus reniformis]|uniref:Uncharacterized protein n=1 Tax=Chelatococcus reniformis TaxID=1494448 RepID=A0A916XEB6_9HYPH|nr:hypothetical protein [Chelatococcus reniformis]GGC65536.1 hypothetical protein GCM10010994_25170 [Chelatococcus reniformis]
MITAQDLEYHYTADDDYTWAETYYIPVSVPEARIFGHIYVCVRPKLGCMQADIRFIGSVTETEFESLFIDTRFHLPAPERFSHIHGPNGLSIKAVKPPRDYRIDYVGRDGTELHMDIVGLMNPFDIHDPSENPLAGGTEAERLARSSMGSGYKGHFDMHGRFTGTLKLRGEAYDIDTVDRMNHSWGPRPEMEIPPNNSLWAQFGEDLGFRFHAHLDPSKPTGQDQKLAHGYVLDKGDVMAIMDLDLTMVRMGITPIVIDALVTDQRGRRHCLRGVPLAGAPWRAYGNAVCWIGLIRWELDGRIGYGSAQENHSLAFETHARGRRWTDSIPKITC